MQIELKEKQSYVPEIPNREGNPVPLQYSLGQNVSHRNHPKAEFYLNGGTNVGRWKFECFSFGRFSS